MCQPSFDSSCTLSMYTGILLDELVIAAFQSISVKVL